MDPNDVTGPVFTPPNQADYGSVGYANAPPDLREYENHMTSQLVRRPGQDAQWRVGAMDYFDSPWAQPYRSSVTQDAEYGNIMPLSLYEQMSSQQPGYGRGNFGEALMAFASTVGAPLLGGYLMGGDALGGAAGATAGEAGGAISGFSTPGGMSMAPVPGMTPMMPGATPFTFSPNAAVDQLLAQFAAGGGGAGADILYGNQDPLVNSPEAFGSDPAALQRQMEVQDMQGSSRNATTANTGTQPGNILERLAQRFLPGGTGGGPIDILKQLAGGALKGGGGGGSDNGSGWLGPLLSIGSGLYGLSESDKLKKLAAASGAQADPFGPYRAGFGQQLQDLWKNPSSVTKLPGYEAGEQAVQRSMAAQGYQGSGNMATAMQKYGGDFFNNAVSQLSGLAGANFNPAGGASLNLQGNTSAIDLAGRSLASIGYGARGQDTFSQLLSRLMV